MFESYVIVICIFFLIKKNVLCSEVDSLKNKLEDLLKEKSQLEQEYSDFRKQNSLNVRKIIGLF